MSNDISVSKTNLALAKGSENLPAHLQLQPGEESMGLKLLNQYRIPPRLKIVQGQSKPELKQEFPEGSVICMPQKLPVAAMVFDEATKRFAPNSVPFTFTPLFFFVEYFCFNPIKLSHLTAIRDRSIDPKSAVARAAKKKETREQVCPDDKEGKEMMRFREALTFCIHITDVEALWGVPVTMSFMGGEYGTGQRFIGDIGLRHNPYIFGNVFQAFTALRNKDNNWWYGYNTTAPAPGTVSQWVEDADVFNWYKEEHLTLQQAYDDNMLMTDIDDDDLRPQGANVVDANSPNATF